MSDNRKSYQKSDARRMDLLDADVSFVRRAFVRAGGFCISAAILIDVAVTIYIMAKGLSSPGQLLFLLAGAPPLAVGLVLFRFAFASIAAQSREHVEIGRGRATMRTESAMDSARVRLLDESVSTNTGALLIGAVAESN